MNDVPVPSPGDLSADATRTYHRNAATATGAGDANTVPPPDVGENTLAPRTTDGHLSSRNIAVMGYEILEELGRGGMGVVYKAKHISLKRLVALKMILGGGHAGAGELARFRTEAEAVARLQHPNIVQIHEIGEHDGLPFFSLEFCAGGSLSQRLHHGKMTPREAAVMMERLAHAVQAAHDKGVVHRDLKPANVLLADDGTPKIADFGLAKKLDEAGQTATGAVMGTPSYMAPEQAAGNKQAVGPAADVYALGAILYELLTGRPPFKAGTALDTIMLVVSEEPVPIRRLEPKVERDLETICLKCLKKEPAQRYATAAALAEDLSRFLAGEPIQARRAGMVERTGRWIQKRQGLIVAYIIGILVLTIPLIFSPPSVQALFGMAQATRMQLTAFLPALVVTIVGCTAWRRGWLLFFALAVLASLGWWQGHLTGTAAACLSGVTHGLILVFLSATVAWSLRRPVAMAILGAFVGAFAGLVIGDLNFHAISTLTRSLHVGLRFSWLYVECLGAFIGTVGTSLLAGAIPNLGSKGS